MVNKLIQNELKSTAKNINALDGYATVIQESVIDDSACDSDKLTLYITQRQNDQCICKKVVIQSELSTDGDFYKSGLNIYTESCTNTSFCPDEDDD